MAIITKKDIDYYTEVFLNDERLTSILVKYGLLKDSNEFITSKREEIVLENAKKIYDLIILLINHKEAITEKTVEQLTEERYLNTEISNIFFSTSVSSDVLQRLYFTFKYAVPKVFFRKNYKRFLPEFDVNAIDNNDKLKLFQETVMAEFDKLSYYIEKISYIQDLNTVPTEYLSYIAQLLGFEKFENTIVDDLMFRELLKNIIDIYKIKGTNYCLELFFNLIGFFVEINEYWFDRRYYKINTDRNPYTGETDRGNFAFYLTPEKPSDVNPRFIYPYETVLEKDFCPGRQVLLFNKLSEKYTASDLLGYTKNNLIKEKFTFFKTNVIEYKISFIQNGFRDENITNTELNIIKRYLDFLTPINIIRLFSYIINPFEEELQMGNFLISDEETDGICKRKFYSINSGWGDARNVLTTPMTVAENEESKIYTNDPEEPNIFYFQESAFESFFLFPPDFGNDLSLTSPIRLNNSTDLKLNNYKNNILSFPIERIVYNNGGNTSEIWILKPKNDILNLLYINPKTGLALNNKIQLTYTIRNSSDKRSQDGTYTATKVRILSDTYFVFELDGLIPSGFNQTIPGGLVYINKKEYLLNSTYNKNVLFDSSIIHKYEDNVKSGLLAHFTFNKEFTPPSNIFYNKKSWESLDGWSVNLGSVSNMACKLDGTLNIKAAGNGIFKNNFSDLQGKNIRIKANAKSTTTYSVYLYYSSMWNLIKSTQSKAGNSLIININAPTGLAVTGIKLETTNTECDVAYVAIADDNIVCGDACLDIINGRRAIINGATPIQVIENGYEFDGKNDFIDIGNISNLETSGSLCAWIKPYSYGENAGRIFDKSTDTIAEAFSLSINNSNRLAFHTGGSVALISNHLITYNDLIHVILTFDGTTKKLYINGNLNTTSSNAFLPAIINNPIFIGNRSGSTDCSFDGIIDDVRIYNRVLTSDEVKTIYKQTNAIKIITGA